MRYTAADVDATARTIMLEAQGEPFRGQIAVGWVIRTRAERPGWWGIDVTSVCFARKQFSCWNGVGPEQRAKAGSLYVPAYRIAYAAAVLVLEDLEPDPTFGATHYYAFQGPNEIPMPEGWEGMILRGDIGNHRFLEEVGR